VTASQNPEQRQAAHDVQHAEAERRVARYDHAQFFVAVLALLAFLLAFIIAIAAVLQARDLRSSVSDTGRTIEAINRSSIRRDCVTTISTARRSVFDNVDIYKAIQIEQLSQALLNSAQGQRATDEDVKAYADNDLLLKAALVEARRLQPPKMLDDLIAHGGMIDGVHYDACPR